MDAGIPRRVLRRGCGNRRRLEGAWKAEARPLAEYEPLGVHPSILLLYNSSVGGGVVVVSTW